MFIDIYDVIQDTCDVIALWVGLPWGVRACQWVLQCTESGQPVSFSISEKDPPYCLTLLSSLTPLPWNKILLYMCNMCNTYLEKAVNHSVRIGYLVTYCNKPVLTG